MAGCSVKLTFVCQEVIFPSICLFSCLFVHLHAQLYVNFTVLQIRRGIRDNFRDDFPYYFFKTCVVTHH